MAPNCVNYKTITAVMLRLLYFWCLHLGNMFHFISSRASVFGFTMSWKHLQWKSYLSVTCVTLKSVHIYVCVYLRTVFMCSTCSCLFWHVAVQVQNAGSGIFGGETSTQHTCWHTHTRTLLTKSKTWSRVNNKFHYCSLMVWLNPLLVLTRLREFRYFFCQLPMSYSLRIDLWSRRHSLFCSIFRLGRHTKPHISFHCAHVHL